MRQLALTASVLCFLLALAAGVFGVLLLLDRLFGVETLDVPRPGIFSVFWIAVFAFGYLGSRLWRYADAGV